MSATEVLDARRRVLGRGPSLADALADADSRRFDRDEVRIVRVPIATSSGRPPLAIEHVLEPKEEAS